MCERNLSRINPGSFWHLEIKGFLSSGGEKNPNTKNNVTKQLHFKDKLVYHEQVNFCSFACKISILLLDHEHGL